MQYILILLTTLLISFSLQSQSLLFEITGNKLSKPSYLFGTIHLTSDHKIKSYLLATKKLKQCKSYAMEINPSDFDQEGVLNKLMIPGGKTLQNILSKEEYDSLSVKFYREVGMSLTGFEKIQPIFLIVLMETGKSNKYKPTAVLMMDVALAKLASKKMKVNGLETLEEQIEAISAISIKEQVQQLFDYQKNVSSEQDSLYKTGDIEKIYNATIAEMTTNQIQELLINRNIRMSERAILLLQKESTFIAVGAAHLGGEKGLVRLLREKGFVLKEIIK